LAAGDPDWSQLPFILPERGVSRELLDQWFLTLGIQPKVYAQVAGHEAIVAMVSLGLGVGVVPNLVHDGSGMADQVEIVEGPGGLPSMSVGLCTLKQRLKDPLLSTFWSVAAETYSSSC
jgi:LysR family positive regulator for ilvC